VKTDSSLKHQQFRPQKANAFNCMANSFGRSLLCFLIAFGSTRSINYHFSKQLNEQQSHTFRAATRFMIQSAVAVMVALTLHKRTMPDANIHKKYQNTWRRRRFVSDVKIVSMTTLSALRACCLLSLTFLLNSLKS